MRFSLIWPYRIYSEIILLKIAGFRCSTKADQVSAYPLSAVLANLTEENKVAYMDLKGNLLQSFPIIQYPEGKLQNRNLPKDHARQAFGRGLCTTGNGIIVGGSSPGTISAYALDSGAAVKSINLTMDVRNAIHGLEIWPF